MSIYRLHTQDFTSSFIPHTLTNQVYRKNVIYIFFLPTDLEQKNPQNWTLYKDQKFRFNWICSSVQHFVILGL